MQSAEISRLLYKTNKRSFYRAANNIFGKIGKLPLRRSLYDYLKASPFLPYYMDLKYVL